MLQKTTAHWSGTRQAHYVSRSARDTFASLIILLLFIFLSFLRRKSTEACPGSILRLAAGLACPPRSGIRGRVWRRRDVASSYVHGIVDRLGQTVHTTAEDYNGETAVYNLLSEPVRFLRLHYLPR